MKKLIMFLLCILLLSLNFLVAAEPARKSLAVMTLDIQGLPIDRNLYTQMLRIYIQKLDTFRVMDRYDQKLILKEDKFLNDCYGNTCLLEAGEALKVDYVVGGSIEKFPNRIMVNFRLLDVKSKMPVAQAVMSFLDLSDETERMIVIGANKLMNRPTDELELKSILYPEIGDVTLLRNYTPELRANGPRLGYSFIFGRTAEIMTKPETQGGFDAFPAAFHFGYQFEKQYLNEDGFQALFEFIPMVSGMDQGRFIPSFTLMNGVRGNRHGWEIAVGPQFLLTQKATGFFGPDGEWYLQEEIKKFPGFEPKMQKRVDSRGVYYGETAFVIAVGKTIRSRFLNVPLNIFMIPRKNDFRFGVSFGYNSSRKVRK